MPAFTGPVIPPHAYSAAAVADEEARRLFRPAWIFAGLAEDLANDNDFVVREIAGTSVVVQNFAGALRAFRNVCTHRFALIQTEPCGNRRLQCPYHAWLFNRDGVPAGIPGNDAFFGFDRADREKLALARYEVAVRGRFVFVRLEGGGPDLDTYLGDYGPVLDDASRLFTDRIDDGTQTWAANWKIGVESVLEVYHVDSTHPETFKPFTVKDWQSGFSGPHSRCATRLSDHSRQWWDGIVKRLGLAHDPRYAGIYDHYFVFPNLSFAITHGALFSLQTYDPLTPDTCSLRYRLFLADGKRGAARTAVAATVRDFNTRVLAEDRFVSEAAHKGARQMDRPAVLGSVEDRIAAFHGEWFARLQSSPERK